MIGSGNLCSPAVSMPSLLGDLFSQSTRVWESRPVKIRLG